MSETPFDIQTSSKFHAVADAFRANFDDGLEHGASFCVVQNGKVIIDMIGGWADRQKSQPLTHDHLIAVFSSGKAVAALLIAMLADDDRFGYEQPIKSIWPEFDQHGKGELTVAQIMSHQSGLSGISNPDWTQGEWFDWEKSCQELAQQKPLFTPGSASGYHPVTFGFLAGEIARRSDEFGRNLGQVLREEICDIHDLDIWIGLPDAEHHRCAEMIKPRALADLGDITPIKEFAFMKPWSSPGRRGVASWRSAQLAGSNCHATAQSLAKIMQMAVDGTACGKTYLAEDMLDALRQPRISGPDLVLPFDLTYGAGLMRNTPNYIYGPGENTVGHSGWGGSCVFADPDTGISAAYVMTRQDNSLMGDQRPKRLIDALYASL